MFWKFDLNTTSHVDKLLDKEDVTLEELMDEDDVLQECKAQNRRLLDFLCQQRCMEQLVTLITHEPPVDMDEKVRFKYPNTACELLTSDVPQINDKLGGDETLLNILYDFLDHEPPLNPLLASFFSKTIGNLIARKTEQVISFLRKKDKFLSLVLKHIDTSAMMDLLLRLISCVEPTALRQDVLNWLNEARIIQRLVELIHSSQDEDRQSNASQTLCDIIRLSRDQSTQLQDVPEPDPLLTALESQEWGPGSPKVPPDPGPGVMAMDDMLLTNMFDGEQSETCIVNGTQVLLTLLETRRSGVEGLMDSYTQGFERSYTVNSSILHGIEPRLKDFHQLLLCPPKVPPALHGHGAREGNPQQTLKPRDEQQEAESCVQGNLWDWGIEGRWEGMERKKLSVNTREGAGGSTVLLWKILNILPFSPQLFQKCCLVQRILDAWEANDKIQAEGGRRRGNMGHLTRIANAVVHNMEKGPMQAQISDFIKELPEDCRGRWESFVEETLTETNRRNTVDLVSTHHLHSSSEDEDIENAFPNELTLQQAFSEYQIQQMTANFVDQFGFNDEEFADQDDNIKNVPGTGIIPVAITVLKLGPIMERAVLQGVPVLLAWGLKQCLQRACAMWFLFGLQPNASLFEACCNERIQQFDDNEEEEDIWEEKDISYATQVKSRTRFGASQTSESSKSDLENGDHDGSVDSEEEEERPPPPSPHKGSAPEQKDSDSCQGTGLGSTSLGLQGSQQHWPGETGVSGLPLCLWSPGAAALSRTALVSGSPTGRIPGKGSLPVAGLGMRGAVRSPHTQAIPWFCGSLNPSSFSAIPVKAAVQGCDLNSSHPRTGVVCPPLPGVSTPSSLPALLFQPCSACGSPIPTVTGAGVQRDRLFLESQEWFMWAGTPEPLQCHPCHPGTPPHRHTSFLPGGVPGQAAWGWEHSGTVEGVPAHGGTGWASRSFPPTPSHDCQTICSGCRPCLTPRASAGSFPEVPVWAVPPPASTAASPCVWNACGTRKAPLVALDSSSSGSSESDDDDDDKAKAGTESTAQEPSKDRAAPSSGSDGKAPEMLPAGDSGAPRARNSAATHTDGHQRVATAVTTATETATRDRSDEALPCTEATLNGPA
nr:serine/threonine-protein phosphatase 6 regulatory subunit 2 [Zonotrichia albicollis]